jgi:K+/H+ antiporter YhaU regulatory subunit KhtT
VSEALLQALAIGTTDTYQLEPESAAAGRTLRELELRARTGSTVIAVVRNGQPLPNPDPELRLEAGDTLVLVGSHAEMESAFALLDPIAAEGT